MCTCKHQKYVSSANTIELFVCVHFIVGDVTPFTKVIISCAAVQTAWVSSIARKHMCHFSGRCMHGNFKVAKTYVSRFHDTCAKYLSLDPVGFRQRLLKLESAPKTTDVDMLANNYKNRQRINMNVMPAYWTERIPRVKSPSSTLSRRAKQNETLAL